MSVNTVIVISLQVGLVFLFFTVSSLIGFLTTSSEATGVRVFTLIALAISAASCFVMQHQMTFPFQNDFWNMTLIFYLLMGFGVAFLTFSCFDEIMNGMKEKMMRSMWYNITSKEGGMVVYVQTACTVQLVIQLALIVGPLIGGALHDRNTKYTCQKMGYFAITYTAFYFIVAVLLYCFPAKQNPQKFSQRKMDSLASFLNDLTDH